MDLSPFESDEFGAPRAYVHLTLEPADIQYLYDGAWQTAAFPLNRPFPEWHRGLGTTYHEAGTLWMGSSAASSVTNSLGRFHHISNAYACDQSVFPTAGSVNPVLTGLTLARHVAEHLGT